MNIELNKIISSVLIVGIIFMLASYLTDAIYKPNAPKHIALAKKKDKENVNLGTETNAETAVAEKVEEVVVISQIMAIADLEKGKSVFKKCISCHTPQKDGPNKVGPNLYNILGRKLASHEGFSYSKALIAHGGDWSYENLFHYLKSPKKFIPGNKMSFVGISNNQEIADLIMYLRSLSDNPKALP